MAVDNLRLQSEIQIEPCDQNKQRAANQNVVCIEEDKLHDCRDSIEALRIDSKTYDQVETEIEDTHDQHQFFGSKQAFLPFVDYCLSQGLSKISVGKKEENAVDDDQVNLGYPIGEDKCVEYWYVSVDKGPVDVQEYKYS